MSNTIYVEKSVIINKDVREVFDYVKFAKNQNNYSVWNMRDPNTKFAELGEDGTVGYVYSWDSQDEQVGAGRQEIKNMVKDQELHYEIKFERPMEGTAESVMKTDKEGENQTKVTWTYEAADAGMDGAEDMLGSDISASLENLKNLLEKQ